MMEKILCIQYGDRVEVSVAVGCRKDDDVCNLECFNTKVCREENEQSEIENKSIKGHKMATTKSATVKKNPIQRFILWIAINGAMCYALYMAVILSNELAANVIKFVIWLNFASCLLVLFAGKKITDKLKEKGPSVPFRVNFIYGLLYSCTLAAFGWFGYATVDIITTFIQLSIYSNDDDI